MDLIHLFKEGGFIMWPLLVCSVLSVIVAIDKIWFLSRFKKEMRILSSRFSENDLDCSGIHDIVATPYKAMLENEQSNKSELKETVGRHAHMSKESMKSHLWILGTIASASPFIGLFGTVVGIIKSFSSIADAGKGGFAIVAAGLSEALVATAAGILVAVVAVLFFNFLKNQIGSIYTRFEFDLENAMDRIAKNSQGRS